MKRALFLAVVVLVVLGSTGFTNAETLQVSGKVSFVRVHDKGGYGPSQDHIEGEVIFGLVNKPDRAFGFNLRSDSSEPAHQGMLDLLIAAFENDWTLVVDYERTPNDIIPDPKNNRAFRLQAKKS